MIPGKSYKPEDFLKIAWRRKWIIIVPLVLSAIGTFLWSRTLPNRYRSQALVLIVPPQVPESFIKPTVREDLRARIDLLRQQIVSRPRLERLIEELNLYHEERKQLLMDQVVELMRKDVDVSVAGSARRGTDPNHFIVSFVSDNPQTAMLVADRLASVFVRDNLEGRNVQTDATIQFLQSQVDESLRQFQQQEVRLETFKRANAGRLPSQVETNLQLMQSARLEIQTMNEGMRLDRERQLTLERNIADEIALGAVTAGKPSGGAPNTPSPQSAAQQLASARATLDALLLRLKEDHPDVKIMRGRIADLEKRADAEALQQPVSSEGTSIAVLTPADAARQRRLSDLRGELESLGREIQSKQQKMQRAQTALQAHERRVQAAPGLESQLANLMRDQSTLKTTYDTLLRKLQDAKLALNLEQRQVGEQFRIIDPARRPDRPESPDRMRINAIGALAGLGFGLAIAILLEYRDTSLRTQEDVLVALSLPVIALVPTIHTSDDLRRRRRRRLLLIGSSATAMIVVSLAAVAWRLRLFEPWIR